jgi:hypothetical protein
MKDRKDPSPRPRLVPGARSPRVAALLDTDGALAATVVVKALQAPKLPPLEGD